MKFLCEHEKRYHSKHLSIDLYQQVHSLVYLSLFLQQEAQGTLIANLITISKQFSPKDNQNGKIPMNVSSAINQYVAVSIWSEGGYRQRRSPYAIYCCPALYPPLEYLAQIYGNPLQCTYDI